MPAPGWCCPVGLGSGMCAPELQVQRRLSPGLMQSRELLFARVDVSALRTRKAVGKEHLPRRRERRRVDLQLSRVDLQVPTFSRRSTAAIFFSF